MSQQHPVRPHGSSKNEIGVNGMGGSGKGTGEGKRAHDRDGDDGDDDGTPKDETC